MILVGIEVETILVGQCRYFPASAQAADNTVPILDLRVSDVATDSATITWRTQAATNALLEYGLESGKYFLSVSSPAMVTNHTLRITNPALLIPGLKIYFRVTSADSAGNTVQSADTAVRLKGYPVRIRIIDKADKPLVGATVQLYSDPLAATTDQSGVANFTDVSPGKHLVVAEAGPVEKTGEINVAASLTPQQFDVKIQTGNENIFLTEAMARLGPIGLAILLLSVIVIIIRLRGRGGEIKNAEERLSEAYFEPNSPPATPPLAPLPPVFGSQTSGSLPSSAIPATPQQVDPTVDKGAGSY